MKRHLLECLAFLFLMAWAATSKADTVLVCATPAALFSDCTLIAFKTQPADTDLVLLGSGGSGQHDFTKDVPANKWVTFGSLDAPALIGACGNNAGYLTACIKQWERKGFLFPNAKQVVEPLKGKVQHDCRPHSIPEMRWNGSLLHGVVIWYCDTPRAIKRNSHSWGIDPGRPKLDKIPDMPTGGQITDEMAVQILDSITDGPANKVELDAMYALESIKGLKLTVFNTTAGAIDSPTYLAKADGTKGAPTKKRVAVDTACDMRYRLITKTSGKEVGTDYYAVIDGQSIQSYAQCRLDGPVSK